MRRLLVFIIALTAWNCSFGQLPELSIFSIDSGLIENADAVIRYHNTSIVRKSKKKAVIKVEYAVTILNRDGKKYARLVLPYDSRKQITKIDGGIYNIFGHLKRKLKKDDIKDYSNFADYTFYADSRVKTANVSSDEYPFTVAYKYNIEVNGLVGIDTWMPLSRPNIALENALLNIETPKELPIRHKEKNAPFDFETTNTDEGIMYSWVLKNLEAYEPESYMPPRKQFLPVVMLAPNTFEYDHTTGDFETWDKYGQWVYGIQHGRQQLPDKTIEAIKQLTSSDTNTRQSIEKIYKYVQQNTRYVNISLGIGGFRPMPAKHVAETGFGDCKALTNFTRACLSATGIDAFYAEIINNKYPDSLDLTFPSINQTNHVILAVPNQNDTIWLECTNQNIPPGHISRTNTNRNALLVTPAGGRIAKTPRLGYPENQVISSLDFSINNQGQASGVARINFHGNSCDPFSGLLKKSEQEKKEWLLKYFLPDEIQLRAFDTESAYDSLYQITLNLELYKDQFAQHIGQRLIFQPMVFHRRDIAHFDDVERIRDFFISMGETHTDTIRYKIPANFKIEFLPDNCESSSDVGSYKLDFDSGDGWIKVSRQLVLKQGLYPKSSYPGIYTFFKSVSDGDQSSIILKMAD